MSVAMGIAHPRRATVSPKLTPRYMAAGTIMPPKRRTCRKHGRTGFGQRPTGQLVICVDANQKEEDRQKALIDPLDQRGFDCPGARPNPQRQVMHNRIDVRQRRVRGHHTQSKTDEHGEPRAPPVADRLRGHIRQLWAGSSCGASQRDR